MKVFGWECLARSVAGAKIQLFFIKHEDYTESFVNLQANNKQQIHKNEAHIMKQLMTTLALMLVTTAAWAQQAIFGAGNLTSPEVNADGTVTFRLYAPKAVTVSVEGDFGSIALREGKDGVWTATTDALEPELYAYKFKVDGMAQLAALSHSVFAAAVSLMASADTLSKSRICWL